MAFKIEESKFDWDVEVPLMKKKEEGDTKYEVIPCVKIMNSGTYSEFINHLNKLVPNKQKQKEIEEETKKDLDKGIVLVIKQIDFLYEKGVTWWKENVAPDIIIGVQKHLLDYAEVIKQKKTS